MQTRRFGCTGVRLPVVGQGTWNMERDDRRACVAALRRGIDLGMTHIDTAEMYGNGAVEQIVAEAIDGRRHEVYLVSKVLPHHASYAGTIAACEASLARLRCDHLDLYLLHWPGDEPLAETMRAFEDLQQAGKIGAYGVSNFAADEMDAAVALAGPGNIACNQVLYHLQQRAIEHEVLARAAAHDIAIVAYSPLGSGQMPDPASDPGRVLADVARQCDATPHEVAIAFVVHDPNVFAIPKASAMPHVQANARAGDVQLAPEAIARLDHAFVRGPKRHDVPML